MVVIVRLRTIRDAGAGSDRGNVTPPLQPKRYNRKLTFLIEISTSRSKSRSKTPDDRRRFREGSMERGGGDKERRRFTETDGPADESEPAKAPNGTAVELSDVVPNGSLADGIE